MGFALTTEQREELELHRHNPHWEADPSVFRWCPACRTWKTVSRSFDVHKIRSDGSIHYRKFCKPCMTALKKKGSVDGNGFGDNNDGAPEADSERTDMPKTVIAPQGGASQKLPLFDKTEPSLSDSAMREIMQACVSHGKVFFFDWLSNQIDRAFINALQGKQG